MTRHDDIRKQLAAYGGDDLQPAERARVEEHLAACASCRAELADLQRVLQIIRTTPESEPPPWLATRVMARVRESQRERRSWLRRIFFPLQVKLPLEVAALVMVCVSGYYLARTVETGLQQPAIRGETPAAPQVDQPGVPPATGTRPGSEPGIPVRPSAPKAEERFVPHAVPAAPQPTFAPAPPATREERETPAPAPMYESAPASPSRQRLEPVEPAMPAAGEMKKARRMDVQNKAVSDGVRGAPGAAAGVALSQVTIRVHMTVPAAAPGSLRETVLHTGGSILDDGSLRQNMLRARIPAARMGELLERLARLGTIVERPQAWAADGIVEIDIRW